MVCDPSETKKHSTGKVKAAGILLICERERESEFLLMRHRDRWDLPKGHCEVGETFAQTALRETEEETGIPADQISLDPQFVFDVTYPVTYRRWGNRTLQKQVRYFLGYLNHKPQLVLTEHESADWFAWNPPHTIQVHTIDPLLAALHEYLKDKS